ncbi:efflux RND transporter permease subunit [Szabonella alba]|uniref:Efflux RND transporter permease subunit n=1 Tax=Szabonella alba TaxID=2804194 RepID=A0A8K0Y067_9RHOB|nr:efflux RND transporter permease subunit [Szabonella alba]MBL4917536.1 efflux RND transporter permease subunit [Szabonella alba]
MTGLIDWAASRARMVIAFVALSILAGTFAYVSLPKEGEPDIEIPALFVSVPFPGISALDSERLLVKVMETEMSGLDGLKTMTGTASEGYAGLAMEFEFGWDKTKIIADVRDKMNTAEAKFPAGAEKYSINEINFSEFPIIIVALSGDVPERTLLRAAKDLQDRIEGMDAVLNAELAGHRDEMLEVVIDPLKLEAYNVTAGELINVVRNNNQLIAAGEIETESGAFAVKIPASFDNPRQVHDLPVKVNGDRVIRLGDLADIRLTFEDRTGTARFNGETTVAIQVVKRKGFNLIDTTAEVRRQIDAERALWPEPLRDAIEVRASLDQSTQVASMVSQLEGSVMTAIALVMIVVLASLGTRSALLVGIAIPTSFLMTFALFAVMGITVSNIVMFGLILAVGMLVDGAIVVVEYADKRIAEGSGPMAAYTEAAKRMFWPIVASTATTLCAFLPMLFWPGVPGEFMGMLPVTLIFVLIASLIVALIYLPVIGGVAGRMSRILDRIAALLRPLPWIARAALVPPALYLMFLGAMQMINPAYLLGSAAPTGALSVLPGALLFALGGFSASVTLTAARIERAPRRVESGYRRTPFGHVIRLIAANPVMPLVSIAAVIGFVIATFLYFTEHSRGVEFFVESETEQAIVYVRARGNLSLPEKDELLRQVEEVILTTEGVESAFAFAGTGGLNSNTGGATAPLDTIGQVQIEMIRWEDRKDRADLDGDVVLDGIMARLAGIPGIQTEALSQSRGPASGKPIHLRFKGDDFAVLERAVETARAKLETMDGIIGIEDTRPLPGIDWQIDVDVTRAGRFGADVATVGGMVQLVTRGILLDTMRVDTSDEEIEIRVRLPEGDRVLSTLDSLKLRTADGLIPLSNFITRTPVQKLGRIDRVDQQRHFDVKADVTPGLTGPDGRPINANERIALLTEWLQTETPLPAGVDWEFTGDQEDQAESGAFLAQAFLGALGLMFIILLAQFNSFYNSVLVLVAVVLSTTGVLIGMLVMDQTFSIIMTGTGVVALAGIVVNNNIVLIDTYQDFSRYMPKIEAIIRTAEQRIRPVLLTTITTMAGLSPMMLGISLDFINGGYSIDSPTALWWKQLATAVVFGLGIATVLTLIFTPALLALRVWFGVGAYRSLALLSALSHGQGSAAARDRVLDSAARRTRAPEIQWEELPHAPQDTPEAEASADAPTQQQTGPHPPLRAAEQAAE